MIYSNKVVRKIKKNITYDKVITEYVPDDIDFNRIC